MIQWDTKLKCHLLNDQNHFLILLHPCLGSKIQVWILFAANLESNSGAKKHISPEVKKISGLNLKTNNCLIWFVVHWGFFPNVHIVLSSQYHKYIFQILPQLWNYISGTKNYFYFYSLFQWESAGTLKFRCHLLLSDFKVISKQLKYFDKLVSHVSNRQHWTKKIGVVLSAWGISLQESCCGFHYFYGQWRLL